MKTFCLVFLSLAFTSPALMAQGLAVPDRKSDKPTPRMPDGRPDFSGYWILLVAAGLTGTMILFAKHLSIGNLFAFANFSGDRGGGEKSDLGRHSHEPNQRPSKPIARYSHSGPSLYAVPPRRPKRRVKTSP